MRNDTGLASRQVASCKHVVALDGLRGVAVLMVMASHYAGSMSVLGLTVVDRVPFRAGWAGVDVFFALSGYLITGILLDRKGQPAYFRNFYIRRLLRICPLYYLAILVVAGLRFGMGEDRVWGATGSAVAPGSLLWPSLYLENWAIWLQGPLRTGILTHYWSLAVEEHFYLVWPLLVWACSRRCLVMVAGLAVAVSVLLRLWAYRSGLDPVWAMGLSPMRMDGLALGALASLVMRSGISRQRRGFGAALLFAAACLGLAGIVIVRRTLSQFDPVTWVFGYTLVAAASASLIVLVAAPGRAGLFLSGRLLGWFGTYSFGLYVWHPIIAVILLHSKVALVQPGQGPWAVGLATGFTAGLTLVAAWVSYHGFERRFLDLKRFFPMGDEAESRGSAELAAAPLRWRPAATGR